MEINSICIYCGVGCRLKYFVEKNKIIKVSPDNNDIVSKGKPCIKGLTINEVVDEGRIKEPILNKNGKVKKVTWENALKLIYNNIKNLSSNEIFLSGSGKITNEDNYIIQKFGRVVLQTNNIDSCCTRLCHAPTTMALKDNFGISAIPNFINEIVNSDVLLIIGSNPASNYPIIFNRILEMKKNGGKIITIAPLFSETAEYSDIHLSIFPGTEIVILNCLMNILIDSGKIRKDINIEALKEITRKYDIKTTSEICKIKKEKIEEAAKIIGESKNFGIMHGMGVTQHVNGIENVHTINNLCIIKNGKIFTSRGEINVQGVGDMLVSPSIQSFSIPDLCKKWKCKISNERGLNLIEALCFGEIKTALISGFNPAQSLPDLNKVHKNLKKIFLVQMDSYFNLTSRFAKIILPTPLLIERNGTITNGERLVRLVRKVREPLGKSWPEWKIYCNLAKLFGSEKFNYKNEKEIFSEICNIIPDYMNINANEVYNGKECYANKKKKYEKLIPEDFEGIEEVSNKKYPFILFSFRSKFQFLTGEATSKSKILNKMYDGPFFHINPEDAKKLKLKNNDKIRVISKVGFVSGKIKVDKKISKGFIGANFHSEKLLINKLFPLQFDEESFTPNLKIVAVNIKKLS
ncbi:MAG: molybdopterin-dependent oxidoreductase [Candidatus Aenigmatarchaeota archaeon]